MTTFDHLLTDDELHHYRLPREAHLSKEGFLRHRTMMRRTGRGDLFVCRFCGAEDRSLAWILQHQSQHDNAFFSATVDDLRQQKEA
jgi:hypothetical protein